MSSTHTPPQSQARLSTYSEVKKSAPPATRLEDFFSSFSFLLLRDSCLTAK